MIVNIYDTGKENNFPYKLEFVSKRTSKLKSKKLYVIKNKINVEDELANLLWLNKTRNDKIFKENKFNITTFNSNDTTYLFLHRKNDEYIKNDALIKIYNDSIFFFDYKFVMDEELIETYKEQMKDGKSKFKYLPIVKGFFYYIYYNVTYSQKVKHIPKFYNYLSKVDLLDTSVSNKKTKIKYNIFYIEKSMKLIKKLDDSLTKKANFSKEKNQKYEPLDSLPSTHPYLDTIPFSKK
jgi:hypothetical protein